MIMHLYSVKTGVDFQAVKTTDLGAEGEPPENHAKVRQPIKIKPSVYEE